MPSRLVLTSTVAQPADWSRPGQTLVNALALVQAGPGYQLSLTGAICSAERVLTVLTFAQNEL